MEDPPGVGRCTAGDQQCLVYACGEGQVGLNGLLHGAQRCEAGRPEMREGQVWNDLLVSPAVGRMLRERFPDGGREVIE